MKRYGKGFGVLTGEGEGVRLDGVEAMEVGGGGGFITGVIDGLRKIGASKRAGEERVRSRRV